MPTKNKNGKISGIVVVPNWSTQPYYATLNKLLKQPPIFLKYHPKKPDFHVSQMSEKKYKSSTIDMSRFRKKLRDRWLL